MSFLIIFFTVIAFVNASLTLYFGLILLVFFTILFKIKSNSFQKQRIFKRPIGTLFFMQS